jgi:hypothetical protein
MPDDREVWVIAFTPEADEVPAVQRIRRLLKTAKRQLRLRAVVIRDATEAELVTVVASDDHD